MNTCFHVFKYRFCGITVTVVALRRGFVLTCVGLVLTRIDHVCMYVWFCVCMHKKCVSLSACVHVWVHECSVYSEFFILSQRY